MKKILVGVIIVILLSLTINTVVFAENEVTVLEQEQTSNILETKEKINTKLEEYKQKYDSESYGLVAYILNIVRLYSIPVCFLGIIVGALNQYVLGTRRLDYKHRGFSLVIVFVTILLVCQLLPFIYALVILGWRG